MIRHQPEGVTSVTFNGVLATHPGGRRGSIDARPSRRHHRTGSSDHADRHAAQQLEFQVQPWRGPMDQRAVQLARSIRLLLGQISRRLSCRAPAAEGRPLSVRILLVVGDQRSDLRNAAPVLPFVTISTRFFIPEGVGDRHGAAAQTQEVMIVPASPKPTTPAAGRPSRCKAA